MGRALWNWRGTRHLASPCSMLLRFHQATRNHQTAHQTHWVGKQWDKIRVLCGWWAQLLDLGCFFSMFIHAHERVLCGWWAQLLDLGCFFSMFIHAHERGGLSFFL